MPRSVFHAGPVSPAPRKAAPPRPAPAPAAPARARATAAPPRPAPTYGPEFQRVGREQFLQVFNAGGSVGRLLVDLANDAFAGYEPPLVGAWDAATSSLDFALRAGLVRFKGDAAGWTGRRFRQEANRRLALGQYDKFEELVNLLAGMLEGVRLAQPGLQLREAEEATAATPEPAAPVRVEVVAMPARTTSTDIERDETGAIVSTVQIECDLKAA